MDKHLEKKFELEIKKKPDAIVHTNDDNIVSRCLFYKESYNISDEKWVALTNLSKAIGFDRFATLYQIQKRKISLDQIIEIKTNNFGVYNHVETKLIHRLDEVIKCLDIPCDVPLRIKFCGDGSQLFRANWNFNFGFSIINDPKNCKGVNGHSMIGIFEIDHENYDMLSRSLKDVIDQINEIRPLQEGDYTSPNRSLNINGVDYQTIFYLGGDLKFLALFMGLQSARSNHPCIYCKAHKDEYADYEKEFSIIDTSKKARTLEDSEKTLQLYNSGTYGYATKPLSSFIPFCNVITDVLHLMARVGQKLISLLTDELRKEDGTRELNWTKRPALKRFADFLKINCKIRNPVYTCRQTAEFQFRDLNVKQLEIVFSKIKVSTIFFFFQNGQISERTKSIEKIWIDFYTIYCLIKSPTTRTINEKMSPIERIRVKFIQNEPILTPELLKIKTRNWLKLYRSVYHACEVTPYMHILVFHFHELFELHGDINLFNQEGFEKKNDQLRTIYFSSTNRFQEFNMQMLKKINRLESFQMGNDIGTDDENDEELTDNSVDQENYEDNDE